MNVHSIDFSSNFFLDDLFSMYAFDSNTRKCAAIGVLPIQILYGVSPFKFFEGHLFLGYIAVETASAQNFNDKSA